MKLVIMVLLTSIFVSCNSNQIKVLQEIPEINQANTAIVVIEFQKTWTEKGFFHWLIKKELSRNNVITNTKELLDAARLNKFTIIQAPLILDKSDIESYKKAPFIPKVFKGFTKGTWKEEYTDGLFKETDLVVRGRCGFDACEGSNLEELLKNEGVKNLFFCGFTTEHCVEMTMNTLKEKGYNCILIKDCTATKNKRLQKKVEKRNVIVNSKEFISKLKAATNNR